jgi:aspartate racemase
MFARLEEQLRVRLPLATLFQSPTIEGLAAAIRRGASPEQEHSLVAIKPAGRWPPLFGMPPVNGILFSYHNLAQYLTPDQPLYALQSRGLDGSGAPLTRIEDMATEFLREIREIQPQGPYYLVGWCMGGVVAYEAAQQLRAAGEEVGLLALIATWPPAPSPDYQFKRVGRTLAFIESVTDRLRRYTQTLARLGGLERMRYLRERIMLLVEMGAWRNLFQGHFNAKLVVQANRLALSNYRPESYPGPVVLFAEGAPVAHAYQRAWRELAAGELEVFTVPCGDYRNLLDAPNVQQVAEYLTTCIERGRISSSQRRRV